MISLLLRLGGWVSGNLLKILMAIVLCTIALHLRSEWMQLRSLVAAFDSGSFDLKKRAASLKEEVTQSLADVERKGFAELSGQIRDGEGGIAIRQMAIEAIGIPFTPDEFLKKSHLQIEIAALAQKVLYLKKLRVIARAGDTLAVLKEECDDLNQSLASRMAELRRLDAALAAYSITQRAKANIPGTNEYGQTGARDDAAQSIESTAKSVEACYQRYTALVRKNQATRQRPTFAFTNGWVDDATRAYEKARVDAHSMLDRNWLQKLKSAILNEAKGPYALQATKYVVLGAIGAAVAWVLLRGLLYRVLAPAASRREPIRLLPNANGSALLLPRARTLEGSGGDGPSASVAVPIQPGQLLAIQSEYFHGASSGCTTSMRTVINRRCLRASLAAGLYNLTQVEAQIPATVTVSAGHEPLQQLAVLDIPIGSAVAIQPEHVIGAVHRRESPVTITRHLRLLNLQAWLTMQFRYLVFHGPVQLVLKGCRGIKAEVIEAERTIDRAYTIGFSANLSYGVVETETFWAYVTNKKGLLRDRFRGGPGILISEESPSGSKRRRFGKRGFEDLADSAINVAGSVTGGR